MIHLQRNGWRSRDLLTDIGLGLVSGVSMSLWSYVYAAIVFVGVLSVYLPVGILAMLLGWVLVSVWVALTSREPLHIANTDDQAVVIFGSVSALLVAAMGDQAATPRGLATLLAIIALTSLAFSAGCFAVGRYRLSRILELLPFPVVCGFMASVGWLLLDAGFEVTADVYITGSLAADLGEGNRLFRLCVSAGLGVLLLWATSRLGKSWALPVASLAIVAVYYLVVWLTGASHAEQLANGWLFHIPESKGGAWDMLATLSPGAIDWTVVAGAVPLMLTILLLSMLYASMTVTAIKAESKAGLNFGEEFRILGTGNLFCAAVCCPPGYTDVVSTSMYRKFGASSRWLVLSSSAVGLAVALFGGALIGYLPKPLMGANIFLFAFAMLFDWLYRNVRSFGRLDYLIVLIILANTMFVGFLQGVGVGILLTVLLFVGRYSRISAIQSRHTLRDQRSSVERSTSAKAILRRDGENAVIFRLRGFLFFGTANSILDTIADHENLGEGRRDAILMDMKRVTGMDISALNTFAQIKALCDTDGVLLLFAAVPPGVGDQLVEVGAVGKADGRPLIFGETDFAVEFLENRLLARSRDDPDQFRIRDHLIAAIQDEDKVDLLLRAMVPVRCGAGEALFAQGDPDDGLYVVESGSLSAVITTTAGEQVRVKKFSPGSLVGELSSYLRDRHRTASVVADEGSVVYHLDRDKLESLDTGSHELRACVHELVATTLAERVSFMNRRLLLEEG